MISPPPDASLIVIGHIRKPHGIKGEVSLTLSVEDSGLLNGEVFLAPAGACSADPTPYQVVGSRRHHGVYLLLLKGVEDRNQAETLRNFKVMIPKDRLSPLDEDEIYLADLPGLRVLVCEADGPERELGKISSVDVPAGQELWTITTAAGKEILFPAVEEFILEIDPQAGLARISPPPGLLELYLE